MSLLLGFLSDLSVAMFPAFRSANLAFFIICNLLDDRFLQLSLNLSGNKFGSHVGILLPVVPSGVATVGLLVPAIFGKHLPILFLKLDQSLGQPHGVLKEDVVVLHWSADQQGPG